jgi:NAD(P)-dependent dehydrogenase (short-subunit alcohol dehydrogenase family)
MTERRTALVTGANKGIGHEIARRLAADAHTVWIGCRDRARGEAAAAALAGDGADVRLLELDVTNDASVAAAAAVLGRQTDRLDVLVNNAGIATGFRLPPSEEPVDQMKAVYEVNVFGPVRVTQAFLPLLKASRSGRIVMMSSGLGSIAKALDPASEFQTLNALAYNSSKTALNAVTVAFAKELAPLGIKVNASDPGYTATDLNGHRGYRSVEQAAQIAVRLATLDADGPTAGYFNDQGPVPW